MSNIMENIKKHFAGIIIDVMFLTAAIFAIFGLAPYLGNQWAILAGIAATLVGLHLMGKYKNKQMDKWIVPKMNMEEKKDYLLIDTLFFIMVSAVVVRVAGRIWDMVWVVGIVSAVLLFKEIRKWRRYFKQKTSEGDVKEGQEKVIEENVKETEDAEIKKIKEDAGDIQ